MHSQVRILELWRLLAKAKELVSTRARDRWPRERVLLVQPAPKHRLVYLKMKVKSGPSLLAAGLFVWHRAGRPAGCA